jgi:hypothetical protein
MADQNGRSIVRAKDRNVEDFILNIDIYLLPFATSEARSFILRNLSLVPIAQSRSKARSTILTGRNSIE